MEVHIASGLKETGVDMAQGFYYCRHVLMGVQIPVQY